MRKFLLASAATLGATVGLTGVASAQMTGGTPGPMPMGVMSMPVQPPPYLGGNNSLNSDGSALPSSPVAPTPGSMVIHLNGRVWFGNSGAAESFDHIVLDPPRHRTDEAGRWGRRVGGTDLQHLRHERRIAGNPVAHNDPAAGPGHAHHLPGHIKRLRCKHRSKDAHHEVK